MMTLQERINKINEINKKRKLEESEQDKAFEKILSESVTAERFEEENE
ncbi:hypothetical protein PPK15_gp36 [Bacillus phage 000TH010]|uniref:Uncharacterized protein n=1 Tax=Bacillus phage 000TH010 TaxID=2601652 RepID=A0A5P8PHV4_9CAUD|nr:hypothetical protein PPK15_gp36 [Bacillus phage 000TH010]QFR56249.1 hypothetical protein 000TH010_36 [Bacillus phage 000TH010]